MRVVLKQLYHGLSACTRDNPLAKARGLSSRTDGQIKAYQLLNANCMSIYSQIFQQYL